MVLSTGASKGTAPGTYKIEFQNAFGLVTGADFKVAGVPAGTIKAINLDQKTLNAVVTIQVSRAGFGQFHQDAICESRPQSLIGEYFVDCNPGSSGPVLKAGATIPVSHTQSTIPADLLQDIMRLPYRQRFTLIVNELGAAAAARSGDIQAALHRAVPALDETDNLLNLLANDSTTLQTLTKDSNSVITALANNSKNVNKFIDVAGKTAADTSTQQANLRTSLQRLPGLLEQLKPTIGQLGTTVTTNEPVLQNLNQASGQIDRLLTDLPAFSKSAKPAHQVAGPGVGHRQGGGDGGHPDGQGPQRVRQAHARAGRQPGHRPARPRRPQPRRRARPAQPRRQRLHRAAGAARLRLQPDAGRQHLRPRGPRPRRRRLREPDVLAVRHPGDRRPRDQAVRAVRTASATRGWAPTSRASTRPTRRTRAPPCPTRAERPPASPAPAPAPAA